jgi:ABC-type Fe3+ transport system permease subunit
LLAFTLSLDDLVIASFVSGPGANTLPMLIYSRVRLGLRPDINALATIIILVVAVGVFIAGWLLLRQQQQRDRNLQIATTNNSDLSRLNNKDHHSHDRSGDLPQHQGDTGTPERPSRR